MSGGITHMERCAIDDTCSVLQAMAKRLGLACIYLDVREDGRVDIVGQDATTGHNVFVDHADVLPGGPLAFPGDVITKRMQEGR